MSRRILRPNDTCAAVFRATRGGLLVDGRDYYRALYHAAAGAREHVLFAGWQFDTRVALLRGADAAGARHPVEFLAFLNALCEARPGLQVYILAWDHSLLFSLEREPLALFKLRNHPRVQLCADDVHPLGASHHQKFVVVDRTVAFVGSIDVCCHRWDDRRHDVANELRADSLTGEYPPYHDVQAHVDGPAVDALTEWFCARWQRVCGAPPALGRPPRRRVALPASVPIRVPRVGLARTIPGASEGPTDAVHEHRNLLLAAIAAARRCIYVENQYLSSEAVFLALLRRFARGPRLDVVFMLPQRTHALKERVAIGIRQDHLLDALAAAAVRGGHRFGTYCSVAPATGSTPAAQVYIHSKLFVVDDRFLLVTSANTTNRSMGLDTELGLAWEADAASPSIRRARVGLLAEHSGLAGEEARRLFAPLTGLVRRLDALVAGGRSRLRRHPREEGAGRGDLLGKLLPDDIAVDPGSPIEEVLGRAQEADESEPLIARLTRAWQRIKAGLDPGHERLAKAEGEGRGR
ncbi:Phosphatidylserine/phosphatidylglycerophosphate/cardiolipin synthase [Nannocystis exedens]|uniref:Phosphatidylserine/phosphatidylglycerophosphate/cardiolipin synthase n=1 Tax=Nannocystis exedens TaxID=54 RepID=A0A1I2GXX4_9BACT|nr:phospholipase D-like domain-containing protein [Nannocystis exedens]PCC74052.1 phospholipase [Nannocystis exedens]SFF21411.1 Phosphatidylserine/phosphatidylglycerophosphate/cardiolipin synthase [Nannocystis exedens]